MSRLGAELLESMRQIVAHERGEIELPSYEIEVPRRIDVARVRAKLKLSQRQFAERFGLDVTAVQAWEQGRRQPDRSARVLLTIIDREPEAVQRALRHAA
ncbi:MAG: type II toxin-antitoxin system MqsA family antitoxin [Alphaproteobacteria bacterium]|nr:type II toxin-antitoxin system MqsA family antitoxin [Alphaproteobacteria bacterium]